MKITELRCTACNGTLKIDEKNPNIAECEYCRTRYTIEWDNENTKLTEIPQMRYTPHPQTSSGNPARTSGSYSSQQKKKTGWEPYGWKRGAAVAGAGFVIMALVLGPLVYRKWQAEHIALPTDVQSSPAGEGRDELKAEGREAVREVPLSGCIGKMAETAFNLPAKEIPQADLDKIVWIETRATMDTLEAGYSFENPLENEDAALTWVEIPRDGEWGMGSLSRFHGLKSLNVRSGNVRKSDLEGLTLESFGGYFASPALLAEVLGQTDGLKEIRLNGSVESLDGLDAFPDLESLSVYGSDLTEIKEVVAVKNLKSLRLENCDELRDFSVFSVLGNLESLHIESEALKDLGFISGMKNLKRLEVLDAAIMNLDSLASRPELEALTIENCDEMKSAAGVSNLVNLKELSLELGYECPEPDLSALTQVEKLSLAQFKNCGFLRNMTELTSLTLDNCSIEDGSGLSALVKLRELKCTAFVGQLARDYRFVTSFPALESLDIRGMATYYDISGFFNMPALKSLNISGMECEINFSKLADNPSLETLKMDGIKLYKNVQVSGVGGIQYVNWDDVVLNENLDFLTHYTGLKTLSIADNDLTGIEFAASLPLLEKIDLSENYVTDLKPLSGLSSLREVDCAGNPISNYRVLRENVAVLY